MKCRGSERVRKCLAGLLAAACAFIAAPNAHALGPHEVVLVVNDDSVESILLADVYRRLRSIPDSNVIRVSLPESVYDGKSTDISPENFTKYIWEPMQAGIEAAGLRTQVFACIYSCGFPTRVTTSPAVSITGLTFLRNKMPEAAAVEQGRYVSELFAGPMSSGAHVDPSATFDSSRNRLLNAMPFPAMMLAFTGNRGVAVRDAITYLERSAAADSTLPSGTFFFAVNDDIRSTSRHWEYDGAAKAISQFKSQRTVISTNMPVASDFPLAGFMTGARTVPTSSLQFMPGAYADHLTSFGAAFDRQEQTKATEWLQSGAAASSGTVVEPYAIWTKFVNANFFVHYLNGCTAIESIYQATACPLQLLPVGDPLCRPWAPAMKPLIKAPSGPLSGMADFTASVENERPEVFLRFTWLVDGRTVGSGRNFVWNTRNFEDGQHIVRVVVRHHLESVRHQSFADIEVEVQNGGAK